MTKKELKKEETKQPLPTLTREEIVEITNIEQQILATALQIAQLETQKNSLLNTLTQLEAFRKNTWERICKRLNLNPLKNYKVNPDGTLEELPERSPTV